MIRHGTEDFEVRIEVFAHGHNAGNIATTIAVVWCRPDGYHILRCKVILVALIDQLMGSRNQL